MEPIGSTDSLANGNGHGDGRSPGLDTGHKIQAVIPPYWRHQRVDSNLSVDSHSGNGTITLEDHTEEPSEHSHALWARAVSIEDYTVISGSRTGVGAYVVWNCTVETLEGGPIKLRKRYSEFDDLRQRLLKTFPNSEAAMPPLPPKSVISKFRPKFLEQRRIGLSYFLKYVT